MTRFTAATLVLSVLVFALPGTSRAQGFAVNEHGSCVMARAGTGVAAPCADGSAINFNPAGIAGMSGITVSAGVTVISALGSFIDDLLANEDDLENSAIPVPHGYVVYGINERLSAGIGLFVPYGLGTEWNASFEGRFNGYNNELRTPYVQPTVAYQLHDKVAIGAGLDVAIGSVKLTQRLDLSEFSTPVPGVTFGALGIPFHTDFANVLLEASGATGIGGNFGVLFIASDWLSLGFRYMTRVSLDYEGDVEFDPVETGIVLPPLPPSDLTDALGLPAGQALPLDLILAQVDLFSAGMPLADQSATTSITMPDQATVGIQVVAWPGLNVLFDVQWINWSSFDEITIDFANATTPDRTIVQNYEDTFGYRLGLDLSLSSSFAVRGGYLYHQGASPDETVTPLLPEGVRNEFTFGFGYAFGNHFSFDGAYQYIKQNDRRGRVREAPEGEIPTVDLNSGVYSFFAHLFGATVTVHF